MKRYFIKKAVTAGMFAVLLIAGMVLNLRSAGREIALSVKEMDWDREPAAMIDVVDGLLNEHAFAKYQCIEGYGLVQEVLGKNEENDFEVIKDESGNLYLTRFERGPKDTTEYVESMIAFRNAVTNKEIKFLYVMSPDKRIPGVTRFEAGLPDDYANESGDAFIALLKAEDIPVIDLREIIFDGSIAKDCLFFRTDHHWTTNTAFYAYQGLVKRLQKEYGFSGTDISYYTDLANYNEITYKNSFIGTLGRKTGIYYSGVDDYTLIYPKFETDYTFEASTGEESFSASGRFEQVLINHSMLGEEENKYSTNANRYESYLYGNQGIVHIQNHKVADGEKVLIVKDSFMMPLAAFLSAVCSDIYLVDPRYYDGSIYDYVNSMEELDYIIVSYSPQNLDDIFFEFDKK